MSKAITLQADLTLTHNGNYPMSIPSGTVLTFLNTDTFEGVAEMLAIISPAALAANRSQLDRTITAAGILGIPDGNKVLVTYGSHGERIYHDFAVSASPSGSPSLSPSASISLSPSASASLSPSSSQSPSSSASRSPSASVSRSPSSSPSAS